MYSIRCELTDGTLDEAGEWRGAKRVACKTAKWLSTECPAFDAAAYVVWNEKTDLAACTFPVKR